MRWQITLEGTDRDISRLVETLPDIVSRAENERLKGLVYLDDPEGGLTGDDATAAAVDAIAELVNCINGVGKLRWGRAFEGIRVADKRSIGNDGKETLVISVATAHAYLPYEEFAQVMAEWGQPIPPPPDGLSDVNDVDIPNAMNLASKDAAAARILRLLDLALTGPEMVDWVFGYAAFEVVRADARERGIDGEEVGWWTRRERSDFTATANSPLALGIRARHGALADAVPTPRMSDKDAMWFLRKIVARWFTWRISTT